MAGKDKRLPKDRDFFIFTGKRPIDLKKIPTEIPAGGTSDDLRLEKNREALEELQTVLYAGRARSLLVIFQGMDGSGKDGAIKHVMAGLNPQGCRVTSFKAPTTTELDHDFLWRASGELPARGMIGIFNRSYYEETLITRVHPELLETETRAPAADPGRKKFWKQRFEDIRNFEKHLHRQGVELVKIFLHISKDEQKRRLLDRFREPKKMWKISESDLREREFWGSYQSAYAETLRHTSTDFAPWYVVPADQKSSARVRVSEILLARLDSMGLQYPKLSETRKRDLRRLETLLKREP